jgi:hypothetical protein
MPEKTENFINYSENMALFSLNICGIHSKINLQSDPGFYNKIKERYQRFLSDLDKINIDLSIRTSSYCNSNIVPSITGHNKRLLVKGEGFECRLSRKNGLWCGKGIVEENIYNFDTLLRLLFSQLLILESGFLIHACAVRYKNRGYLFPGASGSGKTTLAKKAPYSDLLSDELVAIRIQNKKVYIISTPFWGEFQKPGQPISSQLQGIFFLAKNKYDDRKKMLKEIPPLQAIRRLLKLTLFFGNQNKDIQKLLWLISRILLKIPFYQIFLKKNTPYQIIMKKVIQNGNE